MSSRNLQGRGKEGGRGGGPPETTSAGRGGRRFGRTTGRFAMPRTSTYNRGNVSKVRSPSYMVKHMSWLETSQLTYIQKQQNTSQVL